MRVQVWITYAVYRLHKERIKLMSDHDDRAARLAITPDREARLAELDRQLIEDIRLEQENSEQAELDKMFTLQPIDLRPTPPPAVVAPVSTVQDKPTEGLLEPARDRGPKLDAIIDDISDPSERLKNAQQTDKLN